MTGPTEPRRTMTVTEAEAMCRAEGLSAQLDAERARSFEWRNRCDELQERLAADYDILQEALRGFRIRATAISVLTILLMVASLWLGWQVRGLDAAALPAIGCTLSTEGAP